MDRGPYRIATLLSVRIVVGVGTGSDSDHVYPQGYSPDSVSPSVSPKPLTYDLSHSHSLQIPLFNSQDRSGPDLSGFIALPLILHDSRSLHGSGKCTGSGKVRVKCLPLRLRVPPGSEWSRKEGMTVSTLNLGLDLLRVQLYERWCRCPDLGTSRDRCILTLVTKSLKGPGTLRDP